MVNSDGNFNEEQKEPRHPPSIRLRIMKRILLPVLTAVILATPATALAQPLNQHEDINAIFGIKVDTPAPVTPSAPKEPVEPPKPVPVEYVVVEGDNLTKIGTAHNVEWQRLWAKNTQLSHPDVIHIGDHITVPLADEQLHRDLPAVVSLPAATPGVTRSAETPPPTAASNYGGGNTYDWGYCTWYVKNRRGASLPNSLGNANTWYSRAAAAGMAVGSVPRAGAVGTTTRGALGHVIYVESVNADGSINISEMNAPIFGTATYRTASAGEFSYIY